MKNKVCIAIVVIEILLLCLTPFCKKTYTYCGKTFYKESSKRYIIKSPGEFYNMAIDRVEYNSYRFQDIIYDFDPYTYSVSVNEDYIGLNVNDRASSIACDCILALRSKKSPAYIGILLLLDIIGLLFLYHPKTVFYILYGWKFKQAEPSNGYLSFVSFAGMCSILASVYVMYQYLYQ